MPKGNTVAAPGPAVAGPAVGEDVGHPVQERAALAVRKRVAPHDATNPTHSTALRNSARSRRETLVNPAIHLILPTAPAADAVSFALGHWRLTAFRTLEHYFALDRIVAHSLFAEAHDVGVSKVELLVAHVAQPLLRAPAPNLTYRM